MPPSALFTRPLEPGGALQVVNAGHLFRLHTAAQRQAPLGLHALRAPSPRGGVLPGPRGLPGPPVVEGRSLRRLIEFIFLIFKNINFVYIGVYHHKKY